MKDNGFKVFLIVSNVILFILLYMSVLMNRKTDLDNFKEIRENQLCFATNIVAQLTNLNERERAVDETIKSLLFTQAVRRNGLAALGTNVTENAVILNIDLSAKDAK